jgi:SAM-dependent methyltransferase
MLPGADIDWDHHVLPWPLPDDCAHIIVATNVAHHVDPTNGHFIAWMDEAWRVLKRGGQFAIVSPYGGGPAFLADPKACNPITEGTAYYFDPGHPSGMWERYGAKPWMIENTSHYHQGTVEIILRKRALSEDEA